MKIAVCFYGLTGSVEGKNGDGKPLDPGIAAKLNIEHIISPNQADVFIHSTSVEEKQKLIDLYKPKRFKIERQVDFSSHPILQDKSFRIRLVRLINRIFKPAYSHNESTKIRSESFRAYSRWYSTRETVKMAVDYANENNFTYDFIILTRLDVGFYTKFAFDECTSKSLYVSNWNDYPNVNNEYKLNYKNLNTDFGFLDFWFVGHQHIIEPFSKLYERIDEYSRSPHRASYEHAKWLRLAIRYKYFRWQDHEMIRRKEFSSRL